MECDIIPFAIGSNVERRFDFRDKDGNILNLSGKELVMTIAWRGGSLTKDSAIDSNFVVDLAVNQLVWTPTFTESRLLQPGPVNYVEVEMRDLTGQRPWGRWYFDGQWGQVGD